MKQWPPLALFPAPLIVLLACGGCAGTSDGHAQQERLMARWTAASTPAFMKSTLPPESVDIAKLAITLHAVANFHCEDTALFSIKAIVPAIANAGTSGPDEIWTTDMCGQRTWLVTVQGLAHLVPAGIPAP